VKIYTRRGDSGETDLFGSGRVPKDHLRVEAYGAVDELNAVLGAAAAATDAADLRRSVESIQRALFSLGAYLATPEARHRESMGMHEPSAAAIDALEAQIDALEAELAPLERFVLPGGTPAAAGFHVARTVCRRAERIAVALDRAEPLAPNAIRYLNRLSDLLFVMARVANRRAGVPDVEWEGREKSG
jgi:cob(I)alamin adenosyltransferase